MHHKNFFRAVEAFVLFKQRYTEQPVTLKVVGIPHAFYDSSRIKGTPCVDIIENVSDPQLYELMAHASVFFFPSLYEGFGLPPLEAMNLGTPVVASCTSSCRKHSAMRICRPTRITRARWQMRCILL
ncbi:MAG: glycosyltransferase [bacterium]|nr:glycosyltransferase [bacterium]